MNPARTWMVGIALTLVALGGLGCSPRQIAINSLADALSGTGESFASDDDPELIRDAAPFSLKLMESVLAEAPTHRELLTSVSRSFTQYAYGFVVQDADELETRDIAAANALRDRARKLLLRARNYGLRGLDVAHPGFSTAIRGGLKEAMAKMTKADVPLLYWTTAAWGAAITISKNDPNLISDQAIVEAMIDRALELDESYDSGAIHAFLISYETVRRGVATTAESRARKHFERAVELSRGQSAGPFVALAENVTTQTQNRAEFESLLNRALTIDIDARPQWRLQNQIMQRRARWLLSRKAELFVE